MTPSGSEICVYNQSCSGCSQWAVPYQIQLKRKVELLASGFNLSPTTIRAVSIGEYGLRDRMDFVIEDGRLGLYSHSEKKIIDLPKCLQLSVTLADFYHQFRKIHWPVRKGSFRLRVSPTGERGAWLDFANLDIKHLLADGGALKALLDMSAVEIGQRRKNLTIQLRLEDPVLRQWTESRYRGTTLPLYSLIGSFSQTGHLANREIVNEVLTLLQKCRYENFLEYGAGSGNLTFPALSFASAAMIMETDAWSKKALRQCADDLSINNIHFIETANNLGAFDLLLANPPRSGIADLLPILRESRELPTQVIYMSCYLPSLLADSEVLRQRGYQLQETILVDQFPQTDHFETLTLWRRNLIKV